MEKELDGHAKLYYFVSLQQLTKVEHCLMCVSDNDFVSFYNFSIGILI